MVERESREKAIGLFAAFGAFLIWGFLPLYFHALGDIGIFEIMAHRILWSVALLLPLCLFLFRSSTVRTELATRRRVFVFAVTTSLITVNWLTYIYAIHINRLLDASLGYFINPLVNVALGVIFLSERLSRWRVIAVALAAAGVINQTLVVGVVPWIALILAFSFGFYGLLRKREGIDPIVGLLVETAMMLPLALLLLAWIGATGQGSFFTGGWTHALLLIGLGAITSAPLVLFMTAAQRLMYATIGLMQYLSPTLQFAIAILLFREPFTTAHLLTFGAIWAGLAIYSWDTISTFRQDQRRMRAA